MWNNKTTASVTKSQVIKNYNITKLLIIDLTIKVVSHTL